VFGLKAANDNLESIIRSEQLLDDRIKETIKKHRELISEASQVQ